MRLIQYNNRVYVTFEELVKAIRENLGNASDNLSDDYLVKESYKLDEWNYVWLRDILKQHNELVSESREMLNTMNQCIFNLWRDDLECTHSCIVIEDVEDGVKLDDNEPIEGGRVTEHMKTINRLTGNPLEILLGEIL